VTNELDHQVRMALRRQRRSRLFPIAVIVFAACATACAYLWVNHGAQIRTAVFASSQTTDPTTASGEPFVRRADFDTFERQTTDSLRSSTENLEAQKADLKTLSDQVTDGGEGRCFAERGGDSPCLSTDCPTRRSASAGKDRATQKPGGA
jgi:hypothetical protein